MIKHDLKHILSRLSSALPPSDIQDIKYLSEVNWNEISDSDIDLCSEIIIRIRVDCIMLEGRNSLPMYNDYRNILSKIIDDIDKSGLSRKSSEFDIYFRDLRESFADL